MKTSLIAISNSEAAYSYLLSIVHFSFIFKRPCFSQEGILHDENGKLIVKNGKLLAKIGKMVVK